MTDWRYRAVENALGMICTEAKWSKWHDALDVDSNPCETNYKGAVKFSLMGALVESWGDLVPDGSGFAEGWYNYIAWFYSKVNWRVLEESIECDKCGRPFMIDLISVSLDDVLFQTFNQFNMAFGVRYHHIRQLLEGVLRSEHTN